MILFSNDVACGNSADKTDGRGASVVRLGQGPESSPRTFWFPTVAPDWCERPPRPHAADWAQSAVLGVPIGWTSILTGQCLSGLDSC